MTLIPDLVILYEIILPYLSSSNELTKFKILSKFFHKNIVTHSPIERICDNCGSNRFKVCFSKKNCKIRGCMATETIHPYDTYNTLNSECICSFGCLMNQSTVKYHIIV